MVCFKASVRSAPARLVLPNKRLQSVNVHSMNLQPANVVSLKSQSLKAQASNFFVDRRTLDD